MSKTLSKISLRTSPEKQSSSDQMMSNDDEYRRQENVRIERENEYRRQEEEFRKMQEASSMRVVEARINRGDSRGAAAHMGISTTLYTPPITHGQYGSSRYTGEERLNLIPWRYIPGFTIPSSASSSYTRPPSHAIIGTSSSTYENRPSVIPYRYFPDVSIQNAYNKVIEQLDNSEESYWIEDIVTQSAAKYKTDKVGALKIISGLINILDEHQISDFDSIGHRSSPWRLKYHCLPSGFDS